MVAFVALGFYLVPAILFFLAANQLRRGRAWAIILGLVLASLGTLVGVIALIGSIVRVVSGDLRPVESTVVYIQLGVAVIFPYLSVLTVEELVDREPGSA